LKNKCLINAEAFAAASFFAEDGAKKIKRIAGTSSSKKIKKR